MGGQCPADGPNLHPLHTTLEQGSGDGFGCGACGHHIIQQSHMLVVVFFNHEGITQVFMKKIKSQIRLLILHLIHIYLNNLLALKLFHLK